MGKTIGELRVITDFNVSANDSVYFVKQEAAKSIDFMEDVKNNSSEGEVKRLTSLAQTAYEEAAMWAGKAITFGK